MARIVELKQAIEEAIAEVERNQAKVQELAPELSRVVSQLEELVEGAEYAGMVESADNTKKSIQRVDEPFQAIKRDLRAYMEQL